jgi:hypothetical protein
MTNVPSKIEQSNADIISHFEPSKLHTSVGIIPQEHQWCKTFTPFQRSAICWLHLAVVG